MAAQLIPVGAPKLEAELQAVLSDVRALVADLEKTQRERDGLLCWMKAASDTLRYIEQHAPGYDWNADPLYLTLKTGYIYQLTPDAALERNRAEAVGPICQHCEGARQVGIAEGRKLGLLDAAKRCHSNAHFDGNLSVTAFELEAMAEEAGNG